MAPARRTTSTDDRYQTFTTPVGVAVYPNLLQPRDYKGNQKFYYDASLVLEGDEAAELQQQIDQWMDESVIQNGSKRALDPPYEPHKVKDDNGEWEEVDGAVRFKFRVPASMETKKGTWDRQPIHFDAEVNPIEPTPIGSGSKVILSFQVYKWKNPSGASVQLQPVAVQILDLVPPRVSTGSRDAGDYGMSAQTGGYVAPADAQAGQAQPGGSPNTGGGAGVQGDGGSGEDAPGDF